MSDRSRFRVLLARCLLSLVPAFMLFVVCVEDAPVRFGRYGPTVSSLDGKLWFLAICGLALIRIWTFDFSKLSDQAPDLDESDDIQTLFHDPKDKSG
jgi:hypothetical protein